MPVQERYDHVPIARRELGEVRMPRVEGAQTNPSAVIVLYGSRRGFHLLSKFSRPDRLTKCTTEPFLFARRAVFDDPRESHGGCPKHTREQEENLKKTHPLQKTYLNLLRLIFHLLFALWTDFHDSPPSLESGR